MITNIINPLLQAVSFISIWYLYQTMSKVKPLRGHLLLLFLSYVAAASYFSLVKIVIDPLFFLVADLALVKERSFYHRLLYAFYPTILFDMATRLLSIVIIPHVLHIKGDVTLAGRADFSIRCINNLGLFLQQLIKTLEACHAALIYLNEA